MGGFSRSVGNGAFIAALLALLSFLLFSLMGRATIGTLARTEVFAGAWIVFFFAAVIWAPLWETLIGQLVPISVLTWFGARTFIAVLSGAVLFFRWPFGFRRGYRTRCGDIRRGGLLFASLFAANARAGFGRASLFTATAHATINALLILFSFGIDR